MVTTSIAKIAMEVVMFTTATATVAKSAASVTKAVAVSTEAFWLSSKRLESWMARWKGLNLCSVRYTAKHEIKKEVQTKPTRNATK